jgi:PAS domain S-box-containing protein
MGTTPSTLPALIERLAEFTSDAIVVTRAEPLDPPGPVIVHVNAAFTAMTGYQADEVLGRSPRMLQGPLTSTEARARLSAAMRAWRPVVGELLNYRKDGSTFWVEISITPVADSTGWVHWWVAGLRDITARRAQEARHDLNERILSALGEGIIVSDALLPDMPIVYVNDMACQMTGYAREEFLGHNCRFLQGPGTDRTAVMRMREAIAAGQSITLDLLNYRRDGSSFVNLVSLTPLRDLDGRINRYIGVQRDVTAIRERDQQLAMAQRLNSVGELAGGIAHDFNNLLSSIIGAAQLLEDRLGTLPEHAELARTITESARRGAAQVRRLMTLTRTPSLQRGSVDLRGVVRQLLQLTRRNLRENITLSVDLAEGATWVDAEPVQTESALLNLVLNAQDAMPLGGLIRLSSRAVRHGAETWVVLGVEDNGHGIEPQHLSRIFDAFYTTKAPGRGSGLGLAMTHSFMRQIDGYIEVSSQLGQGSRFELWFRPAEPASQPASEAEQSAGVNDMGLRVLMAEDDPLLRITGTAMLEHLGHQVTTCENGLEALDVLASGAPIDLLFTDLLMPGGVDGWELANRCATMRPGLPVVVASGWADTAQTPPQGRLRESVFLQKPYSLQDLERGLRDALRDLPMDA